MSFMKRLFKGLKAACSVVSRRTKLFFLFVGSAIILLSIIMAFQGVSLKKERARRLVPFRPYISEYLNYQYLPFRPEPHPYIKGKLITIDIDKKDIDWDTYFHHGWKSYHDYRNEPDWKYDIRAQDTEDVGTVVLLKWGESYYATYHISSIKAYAATCELLLVDKDRKIIIAKERFQRNPPEKLYRTDFRLFSVHADKPDAEVVEYLIDRYRCPKCD